MPDPVKRTFTCSMKTLLHEADLLMTAAEEQTAFATKRLKTGLLTETRELWRNLGGEGSDAGKTQSTTSTLTGQQNDAIVTMLDKFSLAKESARTAFRGQKTKLSGEFTVGENSPRDLASILGRAIKVSAACSDPDNATELHDKAGWIAEDTDLLAKAADTVSRIDKKQLASISLELVTTNDRNTSANTLYRNLQTIQNAAGVEWPERDPENRGMRNSFRFEKFPPPQKGAKKADPAAKPAPAKSTGESATP